MHIQFLTGRVTGIDKGNKAELLIHYSNYGENKGVLNVIFLR